MARSGKPPQHQGTLPPSPLINRTGVLRGLVNSGLLDCFLDADFIARNKLSYWEVKLLPLTLIDGTVNCYVSQVITLPIQLPCGSSCEIKCYVMPLDNSCKLVLGYNWLKNHNPSINWQRETVNLPKPKCEEPPTLNKPEWSYPTESHYPTPRKPDISLINAVAYCKACKAEGAITFQLQPSRELTLSSRVS